jgi:predicted dehydrogenase
VDNGGKQQAIESLRYNQHGANYETIQHFLDCLGSGKPFYTEAEWYLDVLRIIDAAYLSAREHRRVAL